MRIYSKATHIGPSHTIWLGDEGDTKLGLFYSSKTQTRHIAWYVPYEVPPDVTLCGLSSDTHNLTATGDVDHICEKCFEAFRKLAETADIYC